MMMVVLLGVMIFLCATGTPVGFGMLISVIITLILFKPTSLLLVTQRMIVGMDNFVLLAIPFFTFAGLVMTEGGVTRRLMGFARTLVGHWPGGLAQVNVVSSMLFSGISGTGTADAVGLGQVEVPPMLESGYPPSFTAAITAASSTIGPIVPPSVAMIIFGALTSVSIGRLFLGGILPGVAMGIALMVYISIVARRYGFGREKKATYTQLMGGLKDALLPMFLPIFVLGGIIGGVFTPTEAAAMAAIYALFVTIIVYRELSRKALLHVLVSTAKISGVIMFIIGAANVFGQLLLIGGLGPKLMTLFGILGLNSYVILFAIIAILLILGCFIEATALIIMLGPIFVPIILRLGMDPVHFGVMMVLAVMLGLITPPVGVVGYIVCDIAGTSLGAFTKAVLPMFLMLVFVLFLIAYIPAITMYIPTLIMR